MDPNQKGVPILLKQYLKLGGKLLGFNRDPNFNNVLDALILVDLRQTQPKVLQRYMRGEGFERFRQFDNSLTFDANKSTFPKTVLGLTGGKYFS